jgi:3-phosphoshikimate 1-carboxyvinyltransferase
LITADRLAAAPSGALRGEVAAPGDKSLSHRALILGALSEGETQISGLLESEDVLRTVAAIRAFGAGTERLGPGEWRVEGAEWRSPEGPIDCGNSGTAARLLMGAVAGFPIEAVFTGDASLSRRPMERVLEPLRQMGARTEGSTLPVSLAGGGLSGIRFANSTVSAQVKSAVLLAGLRAQGKVEVTEPQRSRDHTETMLRAFGCEVHVEGNRVRLGEKRNLAGTMIEIAGDPSSAAFLLVAALLVPGSEVTLRSVMTNKLRAGLFETLREMGADLSESRLGVKSGEPVADLTARFSKLHGVEVPESRVPSMIDEYPILAVAAAFARGRTVMRGLSELRFKESDRLAAIVAGLRACGVEAREEGDTLIVEGRGGSPPGGAEVTSHRDHRIAMSLLILGLGARAPVAMDGAAMIATSFPGFVPLMHGLGAEIAPV